jgi:hypothetical protein
MYLNSFLQYVTEGFDLGSFCDTMKAEIAQSATSAAGLWRSGYDCCGPCLIESEV